MRPAAWAGAVRGAGSARPSCLHRLASGRGRRFPAFGRKGGGGDPPLRQRRPDAPPARGAGALHARRDRSRLPVAGAGGADRRHGGSRRGPGRARSQRVRDHQGRGRGPAFGADPRRRAGALRPRPARGLKMSATVMSRQADAAAALGWSPTTIAIPAAALRRAFAVAAILMAANAFYGFFTGAPPEVGPGEIVEVSARGSRAYVALWLLLYGVCGLLVLREAWRRGLEIRLVALIPFALFVIASATWSYNPWSSVVFCVMLTLNIVVAAALAAQVHPRELMALLAWTVTVLVAMSLVLLVVDPASAVSTPDRPGIFIPGELYGVFSHKVSLGTYAAIALLVLLFSPEDFPGPLTRWGSILICTVGLLFSNSASSIVALAVASALLAATRRFPGGRAALFGATVFVVVAVSIAIPFVDASSVAQPFGRPPTLTGRTSFWSLAPDYIMERPFFGYGYAGFFDPDPYSRIWDLWAAAEWFFTPNFHNSALDVTIALGFVGLGAYLALLLTASRVPGNRSLGRSAGLLAAVIVLVAVGSATDFQLMRHNALPTVLLFYAFLVGGRRYAMTS